MIEHGNLLNYVLWAANNYVLEKNVNFPLYTSISFDLTVTSIFVPLVTGNSIVIYNDDNELAINKIITDNQVDAVKVTPSHLKVIRETVKRDNTLITTRIKRFIVGGELLETSLAFDIHNLFNKKVEIYNEYGPTETTVGCMIHKYDPEFDKFNSVPIGKPAGNCSIYLFDDEMNPVPPGSYGEIYIGGKSVGREYLYNEKLTNEKFVSPHFFSNNTSGNSSSKLYKSGDIGRWIKNPKKTGEWIIEFHGRKDTQIKLRGYRIEPGEIESKMVNFDSIENAVVAIKEDIFNNKQLFGYYVSSKDINNEGLREYLKTELPEYMVPAFFIKINSIPLTINGKIDYKLLPEPVAQVQNTHIRQPASEPEKIIHETFKEVLRQENISIDDNFFAIGGDSIKAVQITSILFNKGISLNVKDILTYQTIEKIAANADISDAKVKYSQNLAEGEKELFPVEKWFFDQNLANPDFYNQSVLLTLNKPINISLLEQTFKKLIDHHDGLRLNFNPEKGNLFFNNKHIDEDFHIPEYHLFSSTKEKYSNIESICQEVKSSFDITKTLLIKAAIITDETGEKKMFITAHHLVIDGISWRILLEDMYKIYSALETNQNIKLQYKTCSLSDWAKKLAEYSLSEKLKNEIHSWKETENIMFPIPTDAETNDWSVKNTNKISGILSSDKTEFLLKRAFQKYKIDILTLLNTALAKTLKDWTGIGSFIIEQEYHGRHFENIDSSRTIGWFTSIYPVKIIFPNDSLSKQILSVKEQLKQVPENGIDYSILKYTNNSFIKADDTIPEIRLNYLGQFDNELNNDLFSYCDIPTGPDSDSANNVTVKFDINCMVINEKLNIEISYNAGAYSNSTITRFRDSVLNNLNNIIEHIEKEDDVYVTSSDFETVDLDEEDLKNLFD